MAEQCSDYSVHVVAGLAKNRKDRKDKRWVFSCAYEIVTEELIDMIRCKPDSFNNVNWVTELAIEFASVYLNSLERSDFIFENRESKVTDKKIQAEDQLPDWWQLVFEEISQGVSYFEALVFGMVAHIVGDLPYVLVKVKFDEDTLQDFHSMNDVLTRKIDDIQEEVYKDAHWWTKLFDGLLGPSDEIFTSVGIRIARSMAWYNASRLLRRELFSETEDSIKKNIEITVKTVTVRAGPSQQPKTVKEKVLSFINCIGKSILRNLRKILRYLV